MTRHDTFFQAIVCLACCFMLALHTPVLAAEVDEQEAEHDALRAFKMLFEEAVNTNQLDLLEPYLHDPFSVVTYTDREFSDFDAFKQRWQQTRDEMLQGGAYTVELLPDRSEIYGDMAIAKGDSNNVLITGGGLEHRFTSKWTVVFRKVDGQWKILRVQSTLNPFDNSMIQNARAWAVDQVGGGGARGWFNFGLADPDVYRPWSACGGLV